MDNSKMLLKSSDEELGDFMPTHVGYEIVGLKNFSVNEDDQTITVRANMVLRFYLDVFGFKSRLLDCNIYDSQMLLTLDIE